MIIQKLLQTATQKLTTITDTPHLEAEILLAHVLQCARTSFYIDQHKEISQDDEMRFFEYVKRREDKEPIAYILGRREFWSLELTVTKDTLIPRPETELLVETVLKLFANDSGPKRIADIGTGSGAIGIALAHEKPDWQIYATDISNEALQVAEKNAKDLGLFNLSFAYGDWLDALREFQEIRAFDAIISNPPYIGEGEWVNFAQHLKFEPKSALISGDQGFKALKVLVSQSKNHLKSGGYLLLEHGFLQGESLRKILWSQGYSEIFTLRDLSDQERVTMGRWPD